MNNYIKKTNPSIILESEKLLHTLADFHLKGRVHQKNFKVVVKNGHQYTKQHSSLVLIFLIDIIKTIFRIKTHHANNFFQLKKMFVGIEKEIRERPELATTENKALVAHALRGLENLYRAHSHDTSPESMIRRNDILEARSIAFREKEGKSNLNATLGLTDDEKIKRIVHEPLKETKATFTKYSIPLVTYNDMGEAVRRMKVYAANHQKNINSLNIQDVQKALGPLDEASKLLNGQNQLTQETWDALNANPEAVQRLNQYAKSRKKTINSLNIQDAKNALGGILIQEKVPMGVVIDLMYSHGFLNFEFVKRLATKYSGNKYKKKNREGYIHPLAIARFFKKLTISIETAYKGELYAFSEMFTDLRKQKSPDAAFQRALKPEAIARLTEEARRKQININETIGQGNLVTNCAFDRFGIIQIPRFGTDHLFNITGKCFADTKANIQAARKEKSYTGRFAFSLKQMLGFGNKMKIPFKPGEAITYESLASLENPVHAKTPKEAALNLKKSQIIASRSMLRCIINVFHRHENTMIVQRLAPADIHHFASTAEGRVLTWSESCQVLQKMLAKRTENLEKRGKTNDPKYKELQEEIRQLEELFIYFQNHQEFDEKTIDIKGNKHSSVSRKALFDHSETLALNTRRIRVVEHEDGAISIQCYVGATGVDQVNVPHLKHKHHLGEDYGSMGFGHLDQSNWLEGLATKKESIKLDPKKNNELGMPAGKFDKTGSTIICIHFSKDLVPIKSVEDFTKIVKHTVTKESLLIRIRNCFAKTIIGKCFKMKIIESLRINRAIEVQGDWGQILALPKAYVAFKAIRKVISKEEMNNIISSPNQTEEEILEKILESFKEKMSPLVECPPNMHEQEFRIANQVLRALLSKEGSLTVEQEDLYDKIHQALDFHIKKIRNAA